MLADELDYVVGVDTHLDEHVLAVVASPSGAVVAERSVRASARGYASALRFALEAGMALASGRSRAQAVTAPALRATSSAVARRCSRRAVYRRASGDCAAKTTPSTRCGPLARRSPARHSHSLAAGERREALRLLLVARRSAVDVRREALGQLRGVIVTAPDGLREELRTLPVGKLLERCSRLRRSSAMSTDEVAVRLVLRSLARRIEAATVEAAELERELLGHVRALAPRLLDEPGIGPIVAAQLLVAWSHRGRVALRGLLRAARRRRTASQHRAERQRGTASAAAATANSTAPCTPSSYTAANTTPRPATTSNTASPKAKPVATQPASSSATSPATSTDYSNNNSRTMT